ncbi:MAG TPA: hypothetical protein PLF42_13100 [Anaerolineales bacterium]|nr:hypothetical protein [Anaerolineales bacterium]
MEEKLKPDPAMIFIVVFATLTGGAVRMMLPIRVHTAERRRAVP